MIALAIIIVGVAAVWACRDVAIRALNTYEKTRPPVQPKGVAPSSIPQHVQQIAWQQTDDFARELALGRARELYNEHGDWGIVAHLLQKESGE